MQLLQTASISKSYGSDHILSNITIEVQSRERIALVGRNGTGKSTLLKIIAGVLEADSGDVILKNDATMGYLAQHTAIQSEKGIFDELLSVFEPLIELEKELRRLEAEMGQGADEKLLADYDRTQTEYEAKGGYTYRAEIKSILNGLDFGHYPEDTPVNSLSGGQKTRLSLGKLLLQQPDILILDEPTNHLDIATLSWLENYLQHYNGAILIVSHDRYFLDRIVNKVYELFHTKTHLYHGNYSDYLVKKAADYERRMQEYEKQQKEIKELETFVQKNIARASTSGLAKSRRKKLERMDRMTRPDHEDGSAKIRFDIKRQSGHDVLTVQALAVGYDGSSLSENISFMLHRGERVALIGPNGIGKSTLLKTIAGRLAPLSGDYATGSNVSIGYYDQEQTGLTGNKTVLNELWDLHPDFKEQDIRTVLGNFLFIGDDVFKPVSLLSGGEKARLSLAKLMLEQHNFLILDEPTNHLDLDSKEVLEQALADYPGTILFVSHDRYFINKMTDRVIELSEHGLSSYLGDYDYYLEKKAEAEEIAALKEKEKPAEVSETASEPDSAKNQYEEAKQNKKEERRLSRQIEEAEEKISDWEIEAEALENELLKPEVFSDHGEAQKINDKLNEIRTQLEATYAQWEALQQSHEALIKRLNN